MQAQNCQTSVKKKDRYSPHFCDRQFYVTNQNKFKIIDKKIPTRFDFKLQVILWTVTLTCLRRSSDWYAGPLKESLMTPAKHEQKIHFSFYELFNDLEVTWPKYLNPQISFFDFIHQVGIKPLPLSVHRSLFALLTGFYPLTVLDYQPSPLELLDFQTQNYRIITFEKKITEWPDMMYDQRDPLSFWIHDLIHADHFFRDPQLRAGQIGFYKWVHFIATNKWLEPYFTNNQFYLNFCYLISDMNSHPLHLIKTFKAHISTLQAGKLWEKICQKSFEEYPVFEYNKNSLDAFLRINADDFTQSEIDTVLVTLNRSTEN